MVVSQALFDYEIACIRMNIYLTDFIIVIFGIIFVLFLIISPGMDAVYLNPEKLQKDQTFLSVMRDYYDVTRPYIEINNIQVEKKGFGRYTLGISATNNIKSRNIGIENVWVDLEQGKYKNWQDPEMLLVERLKNLVEHPGEKKSKSLRS